MYSIYIYVYVYLFNSIVFILVHAYENTRASTMRSSKFFFIAAVLFVPLASYRAYGFHFTPKLLKDALIEQGVNNKCLTSLACSCVGQDDLLTMLRPMMLS